MKAFVKSIDVMKTFIFWSRWLQAPLYLGLILAQGVYVYHFFHELAHLFTTPAGCSVYIQVQGKQANQPNGKPKLTVVNNAPKTANKTKPDSKTGTDKPADKMAQKADTASHGSCGPKHPPKPNEVEISSETSVMLTVLTLIDVVMIANLLVMVIIGGYETFVSRLQLANHPDRPEWLSQVNASMLKVKLAMALIGISSIHLLRTFILTPYLETHTVLWHVVIHCTFLISAIAMAATDKLMHPAGPKPAAGAGSGH
jgi:uncharacterized protein (TIGR00645 family)